MGNDLLRWLIVEDALRDRNGHWMEYLQTFRDGLRAAGDETVFLVTSEASAEVIGAFNARPVLPPSIWHRTGERLSFTGKCLRLFRHARQTVKALGLHLKASPTPDVIFVPTVLAHHLLAWTWLVLCPLRRYPFPILLFFPNLPIFLDSKNAPHWNGGIMTLLMRLLFRLLRGSIHRGKVIIGVETDAMRLALGALTGVPVHYFPHPVAAPPCPGRHSGTTTLAACYGAARHEKGSDLLQEALHLLLQNPDAGGLSFAYQWLQDFPDADGNMVSVPASLESHPRVHVIRRNFQPGEYQEHLSATDIMLLPYRKSSYNLRVSRVAIEAMTSGIPLLATAGTTMEQQAATFGAAAVFPDGDASGLAAAAAATAQNLATQRELATARRTAACEHFSVGNFRGILLSMLPATHKDVP